MWKQAVFAFLFLLPLCAVAQGRTDTFRIYFDLDVPTPNAGGTQLLDSLLYYDVIGPAKSVLIIGYADNKGSNEYNDQLSASRAENVKSYLVEMHVPAERIKLCIGTGEVARGTENEKGYAQDRKVDLVVSHAKKAVPVIVKGSKKVGVPAAPVAPKKQPTDIREVQKGETFVLNNIYFYPGRHFVRNESMGEIDKLYHVLEENETMRIRIEGHICCVTTGTDAMDEDTFELQLSTNRARYIYEYLAQKGIDKERMEYMGFGRSRPLVKEITAEDENKNRRVEIRVLEK